MRWNGWVGIAVSAVCWTGAAQTPVSLSGTELSSLRQVLVDGGEVAAGEVLAENEVLLSAQSTPGQCAGLFRLDFQVSATSPPFDAGFVHTSSVACSGRDNHFRAPVFDLAPNQSFTWRVRERNVFNDSVTAWFDFADGGIAFRTAAAPTPRLTFSGPVQTVVAGTCSAPLQLTRAGDTAARSVAVGVAHGYGVTLHANPACSPPAMTSVAYAAGATTAALYFRAERVFDPPRIYADAPGLFWATQEHRLTPSSLFRLYLFISQDRLLVGQCSRIVVVGGDQFFNEVSVDAGVNSTLRGESPTTAIFSGSSCVAPVNTLVFPGGASRVGGGVVVYEPGLERFIVSPPGLTGDIRSYPVDPFLAFVEAPDGGAVGDCVGPLWLERQLADGGAWSGVRSDAGLAANPPLVRLEALGTTVTFFDDSQCTTAYAERSFDAGSSRLAVYVSAVDAGECTITASSGVATATLPLSFAAREEDGGVDPTRLRLTVGCASADGLTGLTAAVLTLGVAAARRRKFRPRSERMRA